jgi:hypothetical protein
MDRRTVPPWLTFLKQSENKSKATAAINPTDSAAATPPAPPVTAATPAPKPASTAPSDLIVTQSENGKIQPDGTRKYLPGTELLRNAVQTACIGNRIPSEFALVWINVESGGNRFSTDSDHATGIFQLLPEECASLRSVNFPNGVSPAALVNDPHNATAILAGLDYINIGRTLADNLAKQYGMSWSEGDMWRLTKFSKHDLPAYARTSLAAAKTALGRPPVDWNEFYHTVVGSANGVEKKALNNASAVGILPGATGTIISDSDKVPFTAGAPRAATAGPSSAASPPPTTPTPSAAPNIPPLQYDAIAGANEDVYHLYAKFEYFRERYAKRSGSANITWNPYVVPGFPGVIFDQRASRVDLMVYITTVQHRMSHDGQRSTTLSYLYGRQLQEMFDLMAQEFSESDSTARGSAPEEPVRDVSKVVQSFIQAETYYQKLFYGAQQLYGKAASFDFRNIIGYAPVTAGGAPEPIFVDGPDVATEDTNVAANTTLATLIPLRDAVNATILSLQAQIDAANKTIASTQPTQTTDAFNVVATVQQQQLQDAQAALTQLNIQQSLYKTQLVSLNSQITAAYATLNSTTNTTGVSRVEHNLTGTKDLVPLSSTQALFNSRDAALRYNWRPICTLDEYIVFYDTAGQGAIPAFGHPRSVGARYFDRIRTLTGATPGFSPPLGSDGQSGLTVPGLTETNFPQTANTWDSALLEYKSNVLTVKAPLT